MAYSQQFPHRDPSGASRMEPVLITEAEPSQAEQHDARKRRYVITMGIRMVSLIAAAMTYQVSVWLMAVFAVLGTVLPWFAVVMANDRPPKKRVEVNRYTAPRPDRVLENPAASARVIDM
jgi:Flp pilus assembly protein TadB